MRRLVAILCLCSLASCEKPSPQLQLKAVAEKVMAAREAPVESGPDELPKVGDSVWAQDLYGGWSHGKIDKASQIGFQVAFDHGGKADQTMALIAVNRVPQPGTLKIGDRVLAWSDSRLGTVAEKLEYGHYSVQLDDGGSATTALRDLRLIAVRPAPMRAAKVGDAVWAQRRRGFWEEGKTDKATDIGLLVRFVDGQQADLPIPLIVVDRQPKLEDVKVGARILAKRRQESSIGYSPGTVIEKKSDGTYAVRYDILQAENGDKGPLLLEDIRLMAVQP